MLTKYCVGQLSVGQMVGLYMCQPNIYVGQISVKKSVFCPKDDKVNLCLDSMFWEFLGVIHKPSGVNVKENNHYAMSLPFWEMSAPS